MFVIKFNDSYYLYKDFTVGKDIYKAKTYVDKNVARLILKGCLSNYEYIKGWEEPDDGLDTFKVVEVELREVEDENNR